MERSPIGIFSRFEWIIRRLHRTCRAVGFAEVDYADFSLRLGFGRSVKGRKALETIWVVTVAKQSGAEDWWGEAPELPRRFRKVISAAKR